MPLICIDNGQNTSNRLPDIMTVGSVILAVSSKEVSIHESVLHLGELRCC